MSDFIKSLKAALFRPTTSVSGDEAPTVYRGENLVLRGANLENPYFEAFPGNLDLAETYDLTDFPLTGTLSFTAGSTAVVGSGTSFIDQLHPGQHILAGTQVLAVKSVTDDTHFTCSRAPDTTESGKTGYRLLQMSEVDGKRCVMCTGNVIEVGRGHMIAVGSGTVFINGAELDETLVATARPKAAIYQPATDDFDVVDLGYASAPPQPTIEMIPGGTKMVEGNKHSFQLSYWSGYPEGTNGYSDPCEAVLLDTGMAPIEIGATNNKFRMDLTPSLVGKPAHAKGFIIWGSQAGKKTTSIVAGGGSVTTTSANEGHYESGPRLRVAKVLIADLLPGDLYEFEYSDEELGEEVTGGNDRPVPSEFVSEVDGRPIYISNQGKATEDDGDGSNPGPGVVMGKYGNPDAAPLEWSAKVGGAIVGFIAAVGRWFMMTSSGLEFIFSTGLLGSLSLGGVRPELPLSSRPYWKTGAANRYSINIIDDTLIGRSGGRFFKSVGSGDENVSKYDFGGVVEDITRDWNDGHVLTGNDAKNTQAIFFHTAAYKNAQGYWVTEILPYLLYNAWLPKIVLSSSTRDMIVSGIATVDEKLEFVCGGRVSGGTFEQRTYRFAAGQADLTSMPWHIVWQPTDDGLDNNSKQLDWVQLTGKLTEPVLQIHGARPGQTISTANMEAGNNSADPDTFFSGNISFSSTEKITRYLRKRFKFKNLASYAIRLSGEWDGAGDRDRLDELVIGVSTHGRER